MITRYWIRNSRKSSNNLTELAASICDAPVSMINLIDESRQWSKSILGLDNEFREVPRNTSVCQHTIYSDGVYEIKSLSEHPEYKDFPYVKDSPNLEYYLGAPLTDYDGNSIGALCVLDYQERELSDKQKRQLKILADEVIARLELRKKNRELKLVNTHKIELMKILSHDMRSPLSGIIGISGLLAETIGKGQEEAELLKIIEQSAEQLNHMIDEILSYSIIESKGFSILRKQTDIDLLTDKIRRLFEPTAVNKNISLTIENKNIDSLISIDKEKFEQIFGNLISNSIKFTKRGGQVSGTVSISHSEVKPVLNLIVEDNGIGMSKKVLKNLIENNSDHSEAGTSGEKNSGIGMHIIKNFVELHDGIIHVESEIGMGTKFEINLPVKED